MTVMNTVMTETAAECGHVDEPVQKQLDLGRTAMTADGDCTEPRFGPASSGDIPDARRVFVPSNRECILQQLGALVLSPGFPPTAGTPAGTSREPFVVHDGLRSDEIEILSGGRLQRFPVLAEIRNGAYRDGAGALGILDVEALHFRNEEEINAFRLRPFDELDTEHFRCIASPSLFTLDGASRFAYPEKAGVAENGCRGLLADRIAGAVTCLLELSRVDHSCREVAAGLLAGQTAVPWMKDLWAWPAAQVCEGRGTGAHVAIMQAFIAHERTSPGDLVQEVGRRLGELADPEVTHALPVWLDRAEAVLSNRMVLDGKVLSDEKTIALRAAILAVVVDDVEDLVPFLYAERPAGRQVVAAAAFLVGLRTGVADLPWHKKLPYLGLLSPLLVALHESGPATRTEALSEFQVEPDTASTASGLALYWRGQQLIRPIPRNPASASPETRASHSDVETSSADERTCPAGGTGYMNLTCPEGRVIEVVSLSSTGHATGLRHVLHEADTLYTQKKLLEAACTPGIGWRPGISADGLRALYADIPDIRDGPSAALLEAMILKLPEALGLYLKPKVRSRAPGKKPARKDQS